MANTKRKKLTISIVTRGRDCCLSKCVNRLLEQDCSEVFIHIIDNNDKPLPCTSEKVKYFHEKHVGIPYARNRALAECHTPFMAFIDDDCLPSKNWIQQTLRAINKHPSSAFIIGQTKLLNHGYFPQNNFKRYLTWFNSNIKKKGQFACLGIDTKNIVFNIKKISGINFDTNFSIFEDVDFGVELNQRGLTGHYFPKMVVEHPEVSSPIKIITKNFHRGRFKFFIEQKWGNADNYQPLTIFQLVLNTIRDPVSFFSQVTEYSFGLGFQQSKYHPNPEKLITIVNSIDHSANGERARETYQFLKKNGQNVITFDSRKAFDRVTDNILSIFEFPTAFLKYRFFRFLKFSLHLSVDHHFIFSEFNLRSQTINKYLQSVGTKIAIFQCSEDIACIPNKNYYSFYDSPTIFSEENKNHAIKDIESKAFHCGDFVSFHWYSFLKLAKKKGYNISHPYILNWGCKPFLSENNILFSEHHEIVYLGSTDSPWINPPLLSRLQSDSKTPIRIFGYGKPVPGSVHSGFMNNLSDLKRYKFGLITITNDELRNNGFSAKHLLYISYGLPVLCPEWRQDKLLEPATIYYNEKNFNQQIKKYSQKKEWLKKHHAAIKLSQELAWDKTLQPLLTKIKSIYEEE